MTSLGSPGSSSQLVLGFSGRKRPKKPEMDWYDKPRKPRLVVAPVHFGVFGPKGATTKRNGTGSPGLSSQSISGFCGRKGPQKPETDWDDKLWKTRLVIPVCFGFSCSKRARKHPKRNGMTRLGSQGLSSQSVSGPFGRKGPQENKTDWDDNPGKPRLVIPGNPRFVIPACFRVFWPKRTKKTRNRRG